MTIEIRLAESEAELAAVARLRYDVYVEELGRYGTRADHGSRMLADAEDPSSWVFIAIEDGAVLASTRITWGGQGFSPRQVAQYQLTPFLDELGPELLSVGERTTVHPDHRGTPLLGALLEAPKQHLDSEGVQVVFGACEPHLLSTYIDMGQQPYADRNINSPDAGYLVPLVAFSDGPEPLRGRGYHAEDLPSCVRRALDQSSSVTCATSVSPAEFCAQVQSILGEATPRPLAAFAGMTEEEIGHCLRRSAIIACRRGDRILLRGGSSRNMFILLDGTLEARDDDGVVGVLSPGDLFGEVAFLLQQPRSLDVVAATDTRVLSLSDSTVRRLLDQQPAITSKLLLNLSRLLATRLLPGRTRPPEAASVS